MDEKIPRNRGSARSPGNTRKIENIRSPVSGSVPKTTDAGNADQIIDFTSKKKSVPGNSVPPPTEVKTGSGTQSDKPLYYTDRNGNYYDPITHERMYQSKDGNFYNQVQALEQGIITNRTLEQERAEAYQNSRNAAYIQQNQVDTKGQIPFTDSTADKARLVTLREEAGFGANVSGFRQDSSYRSMMEIANRERQTFVSEDAAYAQSRIFASKLESGLSSEEAYHQAQSEYKQMVTEGHSAESIVATLNGMKQEDVEFLKMNGQSLRESGFTLGQRSGVQADTGNGANQEAQRIVDRLAGEDGKIVIRNRSNDGSGVVDHRMYQFSGRYASIARGSQSAVTGVSRMGLMLFYSSAGESGSGLRKTEDYLTLAHLTVGMTVLNTARRVINRPLASELNGLLKANGAVSVLAYRKALNSRLAGIGAKPYSISLSGAALTRTAQANIISIRLRIAKSGATPGLTTALQVAKQYRQLGVLTTFAKTPVKMKLGRRMFRISSIGLRSFMNDESFKGLDMTARYTRSAMSAGRAFIWASRKVAMVNTRVAGAAINLTGKAATKAGTAMAKSGNAGVAKVGRGLQKYGRGVKKVGTAKRKVGVKMNHVKENVRGFVRDPFNLKAKTRRQIENIIKKGLGKLASRFTVFGKISKAARAISKVAAIISTILGALSQLLFLLIGLLLFIIVVLIFVNILITMIAGAFDFSGYDESVKEVIVETVQECYEEDMQKMLDIADDYDNSTISYDDTFRDIEQYNEYKEDAEAESFIQSTNCGEIIVMTLVRFGYDIDSIVDASEDDPSWMEKREIEKYIEELYYGSHEIYVDVVTTTYEVDTGEVDEDGNPIMETREKTDASLKYRTYYFEYMFDESLVSLGRSETPVIYNGSAGGDSVYGLVSSWDDMYANMRNNGFTHEGAAGMMANLAVETAGGQAYWTESDIRNNFIDTTLVSNDGHNSYGIVQWTGGRRTNLINWCIENNYDHTTIAGQLAYMYYEMETSYSGTYNYLRTDGHSAQDCGLYIATHYEVCAEAYRPKRGVLAETFASMYSAYKDDWSELVNQGQQIASYAASFAGKIHYVWGGGRSAIFPEEVIYNGNTSIGTDCSGFIHLVFNRFGINVPAQSSSIASGGTQISLDEIQPGDILWRSGHVAIYIGNGQIVQASDCYGGDHSRDLNISSVNGQTWGSAVRYWE